MFPGDPHRLEHLAAVQAVCRRKMSLRRPAQLAIVFILPV